MNKEDAFFLPGLFASYSFETSCAFIDQGSGIWERSAEERRQLAAVFLKNGEVWCN